MLVVGLTGGIASGKSKAADEFLRLGAAVIDADTMAHDLVKPTQPAFNRITQHFGKAILRQDGSLNRERLGAIIFTQASQRVWLEQLLHPLIYQNISTQLKSVTAPYCLVVIPLLIESGSHPRIQRILVVDVDPKIQQQRLLQRSPLSVKQAKHRLLAQVKREERLAQADDIINNNGDLAHLKQQVAHYHQYYLQLVLQ